MGNNDLVTTLEQGNGKNLYFGKNTRLFTEIGVYVLSITAALFVYAIFIAMVGGNVFRAYGTIIQVSLGNSIGFAQTMNKWTPLMLGAIAVGLGKRAGVVNIGVDGQIFFGGTVATGIAFALEPYNLPAYSFFPLLLLGGLIGGGMWGGIAGLLKGQLGVNEIFVTVMLNFIAILLADYFSSGPWNDLMSGDSMTLPIPKSTYLPVVLTRGGGHLGLLFALLTVVGVYFLLEKTLLGYSMKAVGSNSEAARVGGINCKWIFFLGLFLSGAIAGLAGSIEVAGVHHRLLGGLSPNYGIMAIIIAAIGRDNPIGAMLASLFFAILFVGSDSLQRSIGLPASAVIALQGLMFLFILFGRAMLERSSLNK